MRIQTTIMLYEPDEAGEEVHVALIWMSCEPQIGSFLWFTGDMREKALEKFKTSAFEVKQVAHWVNETWNPNTHMGDPIHAICLYVEPVL